MENRKWENSFAALSLPSTLPKMHLAFAQEILLESSTCPRGSCLNHSVEGSRRRRGRGLLLRRLQLFDYSRLGLSSAINSRQIMRLWVASRSLALMNHGRVNHWANKWMNEWVSEWVSEWVYSMGESWPAKVKLKRSRCSAAMHCEFLPLWQIHKLRHSTINKWRRHCRYTARVFCGRNCQGKRQQESGRERERSSEQAASKSLSSGKVCR